MPTVYIFVIHYTIFLHISRINMSSKISNITYAFALSSYQYQLISSYDIIMQRNVQLLQFPMLHRIHLYPSRTIEFKMTSLQDNNNAKIPQDEESMPTSSMNREMSIATRRYAGEKGYLDEDDKIIRKYDKDGDGNFTIDEAKSMAADFRSAIMSKELYQKVIVGMAVLLVVSWAGNFGLTFASKFLFCILCSVQMT